MRTIRSVRPRHRLAGGAAAAVLAAVTLATGGCSTSPGTGTSTGTGTGTGTGTALPYENPRLPIEARVADLLSRMTPAEKIGQMTQAERARAVSDPTLVASQNLGSLLSGGGSTPTPNTPTAWADLIDSFQREALSTRLHIPLLYGIDTVHGDGNLYGATVFPHNIGLGATRDPQLVERVEHIAGAETRASGPQWVFAPCICAAQDDRWGRTYESFGENPLLVERMETAIDGFQGNGGEDLSRPDRVLATAKHYAGDGLTRYGTGKPGPDAYPIDQGVDIVDHPTFRSKALQQYAPAVQQHHVGSVMPSFSSVQWADVPGAPPVKMHADQELITGVLKNSFGFHGFVISDWEGIHQIPDPSDATNSGLTAYKVRTGVNAGIDMFMEPNTAPQFAQLLAAEVAAGRVPPNRIDDAVRRILTAKFELGLFEHPFTDRSGIPQIGSAEHRAVARQAVAASQVLLRNTGNALPLKSSGKIYVAGSNADDLGNQAGGWTTTWQGESGRTIPGTTILRGIQDAAKHATVTYSKDASAPVTGYDTGIVVVGETPYAEGYGDVGGPLWADDPNDHGAPRPQKTMQLSGADRHAVDTVCTQVKTCVVSVVSGRPLQLDPQQLGEIDALVASWLPGSEGEGVADVLFGTRPFTGKLPMTWPRTVAQEPINLGDANYDPLYPYGWGLTTQDDDARRSAEQAFLAAQDQPAQRAALASTFARQEAASATR
ncbi:MAG TPA: glycoside hydrolase family 3 N-terminal domain-containing protein [Kineosporiaceae bacterium]|nr:glycoside hydrolase family 3 N-terminal domain-containing protein [Kineosporiaceae bacterium]